MDRRLIAYLLIFLTILGLAAAIARARYYSRERTIDRRKRRDQARRDRRTGEGENRDDGST